MQTNYIPIEESEENDLKKQILKHRNPIYPSLKYPRPLPTHTLYIKYLIQGIINNIIAFVSATHILQLLLLLHILLPLYRQSGPSLLVLHDRVWSPSQNYSFSYFSCTLSLQTLQCISWQPERICIFLIIQFPEICAFLLLTILTIAAQGILISIIVPQSPMEWSLLLYGLIFHCL